MEGQLISWVICLITGGVGGNIAGVLFKNLSLGRVGNTIAGLLGGGLGGQILTAPVGGAGPSGILANIAGSGVGSIALVAVVGLINNFLAEKK